MVCGVFHYGVTVNDLTLKIFLTILRLLLKYIPKVTFFLKCKLEVFSCYGI